MRLPRGCARGDRCVYPRGVPVVPCGYFLWMCPQGAPMAGTTSGAENITGGSPSPWSAGGRRDPDGIATLILPRHLTPPPPPPPQVNGIIVDERSPAQPNASLWKLLVGDETMAIWATETWPQTPWVDPQPEGLKAWFSCGQGCLYELGNDPSERHVRGQPTLDGHPSHPLDVYVRTSPPTTRMWWPDCWRM